MPFIDFYRFKKYTSQIFSLQLKYLFDICTIDVSIKFQLKSSISPKSVKEN